MSEANRTEELMKNADFENFDLRAVLASTLAAYADAWPDRRFAFNCDARDAPCNGSPELIIQMLDKLVDNAVEFTAPDDEIRVSLDVEPDVLILSVNNPGPPLPEEMRTQLFHSMVSVRSGETGKHLGLGLYIARLIAEGHDGSIEATNTDNGVMFQVRLPAAD
jgi:signal transduction histidine kinase